MATINCGPTVCTTCRTAIKNKNYWRCFSIGSHVYTMIIYHIMDWIFTAILLLFFVSFLEGRKRHKPSGISLADNQYSRWLRVKFYFMFLLCLLDRAVIWQRLCLWVVACLRLQGTSIRHTLPLQHQDWEREIFVFMVVEGPSWDPELIYSFVFLVLHQHLCAGGHASWRSMELFIIYL